jgi:DNA-directed RNA polymerase subunit alpha
MDTNIKQIETKKLEDGSIESVFEIEPLERGFGITLGNTLRRICLSHLEGTAVTSARIEGATHEFSTLKGVVEDMVEIILNLKSLVFFTESDELFNIRIDFKGIGDVTAKDLILPAGIEIINSNQHIATLTEGRSFVVDLTACKGKGYLLAEEQAHFNRAIDVIPLDASFMPIKRCSYKVEQIRIGESSEPSTNKFEKLIFELVSNGSIDPEKALSHAAKLMVKKLNPFLLLSGEGIQPIQVQEEVQEAVEDYSNVGIETLNLSVRAYNCLKRANKNTLQDLIEMTTDELMSIKNFGKKSAEEVIQTLNDKGFFLSDDPRKATHSQQNLKPSGNPVGGLKSPFGMLR